VNERCSTLSFGMVAVVAVRAVELLSQVAVAGALRGSSRGRACRDALLPVYLLAGTQVSGSLAHGANKARRPKQKSLACRRVLLPDGLLAGSQVSDALAGCRKRSFIHIGCCVISTREQQIRVCRPSGL
jgi:hypothetical protein